MDSLSVFADATALNKIAPLIVERFDSKNTTWRVQCAEGEWQVFKYFSDEPSENGHDHFVYESEMLLRNIGNSNLPDCLFTDAKKRLVVTSFVSEEPRAFSLIELLESYEAAYKSLDFGNQLHKHFPDSTFSLQNQNLLTSTAQHLVIDAIKSSDVLSELEKSAFELWSPDYVTHGDLNLKNVLIAAGRFVFIDWESIGLGPKYWDEAQLTASYLLEAIKGITVFHEDHSALLDDIELIRVRDSVFHVFLAYWLTQIVLLECGDVDLVPFHCAVGLQISEFILENKWGEICELPVFLRS